jgi:hypothetical protein
MKLSIKAIACAFVLFVVTVTAFGNRELKTEPDPIIQEFKFTKVIANMGNVGIYDLGQVGYLDFKFDPANGNIFVTDNTDIQFNGGFTLNFALWSINSGSHSSDGFIRYFHLEKGSKWYFDGSNSGTSSNNMMTQGNDMMNIKDIDIHGIISYTNNQQPTEAVDYIGRIHASKVETSPTTTTDINYAGVFDFDIKQIIYYYTSG